MTEYLYNLLYDSTTNTTPQQALLHLGMAAVLAGILYLVYYLTYAGVAYSRRFNASLAMLALIATTVMNILGSSLALSLGMVGALSIIRFRTAIKDPRDTAFIFWAIAIGLGCGSGNYMVILFGSLAVAIVCLVTVYGIRGDDAYLVIVRGSRQCTDDVRAALFQNDRACKLRTETVGEDYTEIVYQVRVKSQDSLKAYEKLRDIEGVSFVNVVHKNGDTLG